MKFSAFVLAGALVAPVVGLADVPIQGRFQIVHDLQFVFVENGKPGDGKYDFAILDTSTGDIYVCQKSSEQSDTECFRAFHVEKKGKG